MKPRTPEEHAATLASVEIAIKSLCESVRDDLAASLKATAGKLAPSELYELTRNGEQFYRCARTLLIATGPERIIQQFNSEAIKGEVKRARRWLLNRY